MSIALFTSIGSGSAAHAQIIPDATLGTENSRVTPNVQVRGGNADLIEGGATRAGNLFHSFEQFNIGEFQQVYCANLCLV
jgi:large exoprotein involved in heme utilization and adhesion